MPQPDFAIRRAEEDRETDAGVARVLSFFDEVTGGVRLPARADIQPAAIKDILGDVCLFEPIFGEDGKLTDLIVRLMGTNATSFYGEHTSQNVRDYPNPDVANRILYCSQAAIDAGEPIVAEIESVHEDRIRLRVKGVYAPLSSDGTIIDRVFVYIRVSTSAL